MPEVREERTGFRDLSLSARHRKWGWDCPCVDLDFLLIEYDRGLPVAIIEYKNEHAAPQYASHPTFQALINLGTKADLPVFFVRYSDDFSEWVVSPLNAVAHKHCDQKTLMSEREWVTFLYKLRGYCPPEELFDGACVRL